MIVGILYTMMCLAFASLLIAMLWNVKMYAIIFSLLSMLIFGFCAYSSINTEAQTLMFFDKGVTYLNFGFVFISLLTFLIKAVSSTEIVEEDENSLLEPPEVV
jgi:hypothetical protein